MDQNHPGSPPLLSVRHLTKTFKVREGFRRRRVNAVDDVSFHINAGETYALVGESGSGKSTTGRTLLRLIDATSGRADFAGRDIFSLSAAALRELRKDIQMIFQDPLSSLDPKRTIGYSVAEPLLIHGIGDRAERQDRVGRLLTRVGFSPADAKRYPHEFSGGQRQRIGIAKALILNPRLIVCDEPVSALDVSIQSQILNLLLQLQRENNFAYLFIAHDLGVVRHIADRIGVMYRGRLVEEAPTDTLFAAARHPYTQYLLASIPPSHPGLRIAPARPPAANAGADRTSGRGCVFSGKCPHAAAHCFEQVPVERILGDRHHVACHLFS
ncbi:ABC transporter ATP-binding protein [Acerihabitans arboris]|uniref:ATP-binding cassette domain-containing protein n=1 Tax=Acerihabitans arboris TaxID=2691583 RepID=A0A845SAT1_9GAMM|nr:ABC transporter ATP-binding protein [Acerihabitans arboris]NDL61860.1 ATP-binding cassette domain-containing protein [Acerihabitans arboris]